MKNNAVVLDHESLLVWHDNFIWVNCDWKIFRHQSVAHSSVIRSVIFQQKHHKIFWLISPKIFWLVLFNIFIWFKNIERIVFLRIFLYYFFELKLPNAIATSCYFIICVLFIQFNRFFAQEIMFIVFPWVTFFETGLGSSNY